MLDQRGMHLDAGGERLEISRCDWCPRNTIWIAILTLPALTRER
jgi:hypothetical protein